MSTASQPLGKELDWQSARVPDGSPLRGRHVVLRPLDPAQDAEPLYRLNHAPTGDPTIWTYLYEAPFPDLQAFRTHLDGQATSADPCFYVITAADDGRPLGMLSLMSIVPEHGTIEIGHVWFGTELKRSVAATEAIFLLACYAFDELGYRRLEWKCNALNEPSRAAALRFGFLFEGTFRQHRVVKGRNRDTDWFAIVDGRWPALRAAFEQWLAPENFDPNQQQLVSLRSLTSTIPAT